MMANNVVKLETQDNTAEIQVVQKNSFLNSFTSGIAWGVGSVLGATVIAGVTLFIVSKLNTVPVIGHYISQIINYIHNTTH